MMSVGNYGGHETAAIPDFEHGLSALNYANYNLSDETAPERVVGARVTANYFDLMGVRISGAPSRRRGPARATTVSSCSAIACGRDVSAPAHPPSAASSA